MSFQDSLAVGKTGESLIARYFLNRGYSVLPVYEVLPGQYKGPVLYTSSGNMLVSPDMMVMGKGKIFWVEAKHKSAFTWHRISQSWNTGIDLHHYEQYLAIQALHQEIPIWLLFLHQNGKAKDTPEGLLSPAGLFGNTLSHLRDHEHHRDPRWGPHGMVYWDTSALKRIAPMAEVSHA